MYSSDVLGECLDPRIVHIAIHMQPAAIKTRKDEPFATRYWLLSYHEVCC